jgi:hypothetical protein
VSVGEESVVRVVSLCSACRCMCLELVNLCACRCNCNEPSLVRSC